MTLTSVVVRLGVLLPLWRLALNFSIVQDALAAIPFPLVVWGPPVVVTLWTFREFTVRNGRPFTWPESVVTVLGLSVILFASQYILPEPPGDAEISGKHMQLFVLGVSGVVDILVFSLCLMCVWFLGRGNGFRAWREKPEQDTQEKFPSE